MAVLVEATSAIIRIDAIKERFPGGWGGFVAKAPNKTICSDNELVRIGFLGPTDCKAFVDGLEEQGLVFLRDDGAADIVIADQMSGFMVPCDWAQFGRIKLKPRKVEVAAAQLKGGKNTQLYCPDGWEYEDSISHRFGFVPSAAEQQQLRFLRRQHGVDVYLNPATGREIYVGRGGPEA